MVHGTRVEIKYHTLCRYHVVNCQGVNEAVPSRWMYLLVCLWQQIGHMCVIWCRYPKGCGPRWHSGLRHFATSRKVVGSIPCGIIGMFHSFRPHSGPGVKSASNRNGYQESLLGAKGGRCVGPTILPFSCADFLGSSGVLYVKIRTYMSRSCHTPTITIHI
jgi:hypothetical protein